MDEERIVNYYKNGKCLLREIFLGKRGLTVTGNKELLVNPTVICITAHNIHIAVQCLLLFGGLIKSYLYITSGDLSNIITSLRIVSTITF